MDGPPSAIKISLLLLFLFSSCVFAQLEWQQTELQFRPSFTQTNVVAHFLFKNIGSQPIAITNIQSSCGCTTASSDKTSYLPDESGKITANFIFGSRAGFHQKVISVYTDDPTNSISLLSLKVAIPELVKITPSLVYWRVGEQKSTKTIDLRIVADAPVQIVDIKSSNAKMLPVLKTVQAGKQYMLSVTPSDTSTPVSGVVEIKTNFPPKHPRVIRAYAQVVK